MNKITEVEEFLKNLKFRKQVFGGISEVDVMVKIEKLSSLYQEAFKDQEIFFKALIDDKEKEIKSLREKLNDR